MKYFFVSVLFLLAVVGLNGNEIVDLKVKVKNGISIVVPVDQGDRDTYGYFIDKDSYKLGGFTVRYENHTIEDNMEKPYNGKADKKDLFIFLRSRRKKNAHIPWIPINFGLGTIFAWVGTYNFYYYQLYVYGFSTPSVPVLLSIGFACISLGVINMICGIINSALTAFYVNKMRESRKRIIKALNSGIPNKKETVRIKFDLSFSYM